MESESIISKFVAKSESAVEKADGDFERDGLLYCGKCGTPKQKTVKVGEQTFRPYCLCKCETEREAAEADKEKRLKWEQHIRRLKSDAFSEKAMSEWTFDADDGSNEKITDIVRRYVNNFDDLKKRGKGLLFYGPVGTGKTFAACEAANALLERGIPCLVTNFARLANTIQGLYAGKQEYIDGLSDYALLVIDDLGAERKSEFMQEMVFNIIDARYRSGRPMIITTNLTLEDIKSPENVQYSRIYDRIIERCFPVCVSGSSRRRAAVRADYGSMKSILGL